MVPLDVQPVVQTVDANGQAVGASTTVTVTVLAGLGEIVTGGTAQTNAAGLATFSGLTIATITGQVGPITLQFAAPGLDPVTASIDLRCGLSTLLIPQTVSRTLSTGDCALGDPSLYLELFSLTTTQKTTPVQLTLQGEFPGSLGFIGPNDPHSLVGYTQPFSATSNISFKVLLPPGQTKIAVAPVYNNVLGNYTLTTAPASEDLTCVTPVTAVTSPITSVQQLDAGDCVNGSYLEDFAILGLPTNGTVSVTMHSSEFDPYIELRDDRSTVDSGSTIGTGSTSLTYTSGARKVYTLVLSSRAGGASGHYDFSLTATYPSNSAGADLKLPLPSATFRALQPTSRQSTPRAIRSRRSVYQGNGLVGPVPYSRNSVRKQR
jgi:hypothetical protein